MSKYNKPKKIEIVTIRNYRSYLLKVAAKTGNKALADLAGTVTTKRLKQLFDENYYIK